jgi:hypothetical protein
MLKYILFLIITLASLTSLNAQFDIARLEVVHIPKGNNQEIEFNRVRALFNVPIKINTKTHLILGVDYSVIDIIQIDDLDINTDPLSDFQTFELNLGLTKQLKNNWRIVGSLKPGVTTNLVKKTSFLKL